MTNRTFDFPPYRAFFVVSAVLVMVSVAHSQTDSLKTAKSDTSGLELKYLVRPVATAGAITADPSYSIPDSVIRWSAYTYSGELLQKIPGTFLANMYQPGAPSELFFDGLGSGYAKYLLDGVEMNDPTTSTLNLYHVPIEFVKNVQYIDAVRAPIYQFNATGALINFQTHSYSEAVPYSKVRHLEEPYNYLITDGVFSQNIGYNTNVDLGFEHQTTDGRFVNSRYDGVNIRGKIRYSIDSTRQVTATEVYYRTKGGMTGGDLPYNVTADIFNPAYYTLVRSDSANLTYLQHHLQVAYSQYDPADSLDSFTATAFFDYYSFEFGDVSLPFYMINLSRRFGLDLRGTETIVGTSLNYGAEAVRDENYFNSYAQIPARNRLSLYGDEEFTLLNFVKAGVFGRGDMVGKKFYPALGASFGLGNETISVEAGGSFSYHVPSMSQMYFVTQNFTGNPNLIAETDKIVQVKANLNLGDNFSLYIKPYIRMMDNPICYETSGYATEPEYPSISVVNLSTRDIYGVDASMRISFWKFAADGNFNYTYEKTDGNEAYVLPKYFASGELYYHNILFDKHLDLEVGLKGRILSAFRGNGFYPQALVYYPADLNEFGPYGSTDFFVRGKIGYAVVYFTIFNITGENYVLTPVYPALDNSFCIGINWEFLN